MRLQSQLSAVGVRRAWVWFVLCLTALAAGQTRAQPQSTSAEDPGLIVEAVSARSAADRAGMRPGDSIVAWAPADSATDTSAANPIASPFDLLAVQLERLPRAAVVLTGSRAGVRTTWTLQTGIFGLTVRPAMSAGMRSSYHSGRELMRERRIHDGAERWREAALDTDPLVAAWLLVRAAAALSNDRQWSEADVYFAKSREKAAPLKLPAVMGELHRQQAHSYRARNDYQHSEQEYQRALAFDEQVVPGSLTCAADLHFLGMVASDRGDLAEAERRYLRALSIRESLAPASAEVAESLNAMAGVAGDQKQLDRSESFLRRALAAWEHAAPGTLNMAATVHNLGIIAHDRGNLDQAEQYYRRGLAVREAAVPDSLTVSLSLNSLALLARDRGDLDEAETLHRRALAIQERDAPAGELVAQSLGNLGIVARRRGDLSAAEEYQRRTITLREKLTPDSLDLAAAFSNLGNVFMDRGDLDRADDYHRRALALREKLSPGGLLVALSLNNVGAVASDRRDLATAEEYYVRSLTIKERVAPKSSATVVTLNNLGELALNRSDPRTAERYLLKALAILDETSPNNLERITTLNLLAIAAQRRADLRRARVYEQRAVALGERLAPASRQIAVSLSHLGEVLLELNDLTGAEASVGRALNILSTIAPGSWLEAQALNIRGRIYRRSGRKALALASFARALDAFEQQSTRVGGADDVRSTFGAAGKGQYDDALNLAIEMGRRSDAFSYQERFRARSLLAMLTERDLLFAADVPADIARELRLAASEYDRIVNALSALGPDKKREADRLVQRLREVRDHREQLAQRVRQIAPRLADLQYPEPLDLERTQASLDAGTLLLAYWVGARHTTLFAVERASAGSGQSGITVLTLPVGERRLRSLVTSFREQIHQPTDRRDSSRAVGRVTAGAAARGSLPAQGSALYDLLLKPAASMIARHARIVIVADGPLHSLPFAALRVTGGAQARRYLVEWKPIHVVVSATVYAERRRGRHDPDGARGPTRLVAFGDPSFRDAPQSARSGVSGPAPRDTVLSLRPPPLPGTRLEVQGIAKLFAGTATTFLGADATEARAKAIGLDASHVHFATHAVLDERLPLNSALILTLPQQPTNAGENGLLQVWEVLEHVRLKADLVTLSACETGLGREAGGEGLIGLTRAFQYAGARSVLASLWSVADQSTSDLMARFYAYLTRGMTKDQALRAAQIDLIRGAGETSRPFHWAPFQLFGDWQ